MEPFYVVTLIIKLWRALCAYIGRSFFRVMMLISVLYGVYHIFRLERMCSYRTYVPYDGRAVQQSQNLLQLDTYHKNANWFQRFRINFNKCRMYPYNMYWSHKITVRTSIASIGDTFYF